MKTRIIILLALVLMLVPMEAAKRKVHTIGDSTMSSYQPAATPKRGWGMYLQVFFNPDSVEVNNRGKSGASTRTFYETENLWPSVKKQMRAGDYLIIQFAHNDEKCKGEDVYVENARLRSEGKDTLTDMRGTEPNTTYKAYLRKFINEAREMGVTPILMSPICRAYFKDGKINSEGRHVLSAEKDYVRCMREVAEEMNVPFLDMTAASCAFYESRGKEFCMEHYFNCGDKTHTSAQGGMAIATLAYSLIVENRETNLRLLTNLPTQEEVEAYAQAIEESGKKAAFAAKGAPFSETLPIAMMQNLKFQTKKHQLVFLPLEEAWPAGEIDEVANRYIEYTIAAEKKKGLVIESISLPVTAKGGAGMNIHINYGFGEMFRDVTTIYENTALPKNKEVLVVLDQPILVPAGETLHIRVLPWYDSNGKPQQKKYLQLGELKVSGKKLQ
jgi:lysophospholipase L1-like esterase